MPFAMPAVTLRPWKLSCVNMHIIFFFLIVFFDCLDISVRYSRCFVFLGRFISLGISVLQGRFGVWSISLCGFSFGPRVILENVRITLHNVYTFIDI